MVILFHALLYFCLINWTEIKDNIHIITNVEIHILTTPLNPTNQLLHIENASIIGTLLWKKNIVKISIQYITSKENTMISLSSLNQRTFIQELTVIRSCTKKSIIISLYI